MATNDIRPFKQWRLTAKRTIDDLKIVKDVSIGQVGNEDVLVELHAASLNYLDLFVAKAGNIRLPPESNRE